MKGIPNGVDETHLGVEEELQSNLKEVKEVPNTLNRLRESQMLSSIFPKYAIIIFVIDLRKSFLFMQCYKDC